MATDHNIGITSNLSIAEEFADWAHKLAVQAIPGNLALHFRRIIVDCAGLMIAARHADYVESALTARDGSGPCTAIGHNGGFSLSDAALISGMAVHGEDFDDTFEGTPVHVGAVIVPAVLAVAEAFGKSGEDVLKGLAVGGELICRLAVVAPTGIHRAGFHPTAVIGTLGAAAGVAKVLNLSPAQLTSALGIAGSLASGIIEYLAEGTSTKRLHPEWAAQSGIRAARLAEAGFTGPRTVFEGTHGFFNGFSDKSITRDFDCITRDLGENWNVQNLAIKPYACGTMVQPFIDCAVKLREHIGNVADISKIVASVGEGTVHRLWEPRDEKKAPSTPYSAKFSVPFGIALGLIDGRAGLREYTGQKIRDENILELTDRIFYEIDPENEYPENYTGHITIILKDGREIEADQPFLRGGKRQPLNEDEVLNKFYANARYGGWNEVVSNAFKDFVSSLFEVNGLDELKKFRC